MAALAAITPLGATPALAGPEVPQWRAGFDSGSTELALFTLIADPRLRRTQVTRDLAEAVGFAHRGTAPKTLSTSFGIAPQLAYDTNINAGLPGETFQIGPYLFTIDEDSRAHAGWVVGARAHLGRTWSYRPGSRLSLSAAGGYRHSVDAPYSIADATVGACATHYTGKWRWVGACLRASESERERSSFSGQIASLSYKKLFSSGYGTHQLDLEARYLTSEDYDKRQIGVSVTSAVANLGALTLGVDFGERVEGQTTLLYALNGSLTRPMFGRSTRLAASYSEFGGASLFGMKRRDRVSKVTVTRAVSKKLALTLGVEDKRSTIENYSGTTAIFDFSYSGWRKSF